MNKIFIFIAIFISACIINIVHASEIKKNPYVVSIYRSSQITREKIATLCAGEFQEFADIFASRDNLNTEKNRMRFIELMETTTKKISKAGDFEFVHLVPLRYPGHKELYMLVDLVDRRDKSRMTRVMNKYNKNIPDQFHLIDKWKVYEKKGMDIALREGKGILYKSCPAYHCVFGFEHPSLSQYGKIFSSTVPMAKSNLVQILQQDKNASKREAAAFLLAHIQNGDELIKTLTPSIKDSDGGVRNSVLRVLGMALLKLKTADFPVEHVIKLLDSPYYHDRNKALMVSLALSQQPRYAQYFRTHAKVELMEQLRESEFNGNPTAHILLMNLSGKSYAKNDYQSWENWLNKQK